MEIKIKEDQKGNLTVVISTQEGIYQNVELLTLSELKIE